MSTKYTVATAVLTAILTTALFIPRVAGSEEVQIVYTPQPTLSSSQIIWLSKLMQCESGINPKAINPNDLDNTPSYGLLQFKPSTFEASAKQFGFASTTDYMNPASQVAIVIEWILKGGIDWTHQFPDCVSKLGLPPAEKPLTAK